MAVRTTRPTPENRRLTNGWMTCFWIASLTFGTSVHAFPTRVSGSKPASPRPITGIPIHTRDRIPRTSSSLPAMPLPLPLPLPLIGKHDAWGNVATLATVATLSQHPIVTTSLVGKLLGPPVTAMFAAFVLGSIGILPPGGSPATKALQLISLQLATPLLLLGAELRGCTKKCGPLLGAFGIASLGTVAGSWIALSIPWLRDNLTRSLGVDGMVVAVALMAKNVGGGVNYVAVCTTLGASPNAIAAGLCVDNLFALVYFPLVSALSNGLPDATLHSDNKSDDNDPLVGESEGTEDTGVTVESFSTTFSLAAAVTWLGERIGGTKAALPISTLLTLLLTTVTPPKFTAKLRNSANLLGTTFLYLFFATAGAPGLAIADTVKSSFLALVVYLTILYCVHGVTLFGARKVFSPKPPTPVNNDNNSTGKLVNGYSSMLAPQRLLVASSAAIGGPATAAALAQANGWDSLIAPSLLVGNLGYAVATFVALLQHWILT